MDIEGGLAAPGGVVRVSGTVGRQSWLAARQESQPDIKDAWFMNGEHPSPDGSSASAVVPSPTIGDDFGDCLLIEEVARDRRRLVFKGLHRDLRIHVAVRVLLPESGWRFRDDLAAEEVRSLSSLDHAGIVRLLDVIDDGPVPCCLSQFVDGWSLEQLVSQFGALQPAAALGVLRAVVPALQHAARVDTLHLNICPGKILLPKNRPAMLAEVGLKSIIEPMPAALDAEDSSDRGAGDTQFAPSPVFAAPEQFHGETDIDRRADVFSLGTTILSAIAGELPPARSLESELDDAEARHQWVESSLTDVPESLSDILRRMVEEKREDRFEDYCELVDALDSVDCPGESAAPSSSATDAADTEVGIASGNAGWFRLLAPEAGQSPGEGAALCTESPSELSVFASNAFAVSAGFRGLRIAIRQPITEVPTAELERALRILLDRTPQTWSWFVLVGGPDQDPLRVLGTLQGARETLAARRCELYFCHGASSYEWSVVAEQVDFHRDEPSPVLAVGDGATGETSACTVSGPAVGATDAAVLELARSGQLSIIRGSIQDFHLSELIQFLGYGGKTGLLRVQSQGEAGAVRLVDGQLVSAQFAALEGRDAFNRMMSLSEGSVLFVVGEQVDDSQNLSGSTMHLIMNALRLHDEESHESEGASWLDEQVEETT